MTEDPGEQRKPVVFTRHARGEAPRKPAQRELWLYRPNLQHQREWTARGTQCSR